MGLGLEAINAGSMDVSKSKSKGRKNIHNDDDEDNAEATGCWIKFRFFGSCISSRANVDSSISGSSSQYGIQLTSFCNVVQITYNFARLLIWGFLFVDM